MNAEAFPDRPINIISPFPPGGATDVITRVVADAMSRQLKQPMIIINKPGGGTTIGAAYVAREKPDGYTLLMATSSTVVASRFLYKELRYNPDAFEPVGMVGYAPMIMLTSKKRGFRSTADLVDYAKQHPGALSIASQGTGTLSHLIAECFQATTGTKMVHIPYKGTAEAMPSLINGDVDAFYDTVGTGMAQVAGGKVDVLNSSGRQRMSAYPQIPTLTEQGYRDCEVVAWWSLLAPAGTPSDVVEKLQAALQFAMRDEAVRRKVLDAGTEPADGLVAGYKELVKKDVETTGRLIRQAGVVVQ
ncbi:MULTISPECIES: tripartite tricarboxylate transporter substrate binding protein [unclassified Achromobacter]|uniref:Bug family tripartite tricarboxylate transporter substrate binding protein n=1 Tax=unclassified Achromobacter TaxID=2626865 RepID=UPI001E50CC43|nr:MULTISPECIES: tripartite tricarboxylate transporter substrate binding protein [unclassified Achromobacter]